MDTTERIDTIGKHTDGLRAGHAEPTGQVTQARVDLWPSRVEGLEAQVEDAWSTAATATETVWSGLEGAHHEVRTALIESTRQLQARP